MFTNLYLSSSSSFFSNDCVWEVISGHCVSQLNASQSVCQWPLIDYSFCGVCVCGAFQLTKQFVLTAETVAVRESYLIGCPFNSTTTCSSKQQIKYNFSLVHLASFCFATVY